MSEAAERWLTFAREDMRVAEMTLGEGIYNQACFHSQQCVEKALKGMIAHRGSMPPRTHALADLLGLLPSEWLKDKRDDVLGLDNYYIPTRYPDALPGMLPEGLPGQIEAEEAVNLARLTLEKVTELVKD